MSLFGSIGKLFGGGGGGADKLAKQQRAEEEARQQRILQGRGQIEAAFAGYTPEFYQGQAAKVRDFYLPQLAEQEREASAQSRFQLFRQGLANSSTAGNQAQLLARAAQRGRIDVENRAQGAAAQIQAGIERSRADALAQLIASADPASASAMATAGARAALAPPEYSPLGNAFQATTGILGANELARSPVYQRRGLGFSLFGPSGSGRYV